MSTNSRSKVDDYPLCVFLDRHLSHEKRGVDAGSVAAAVNYAVRSVLGCDQRCTVDCGVCEL
jgi:hypothetical protein